MSGVLRDMGAQRKYEAEKTRASQITYMARSDMGRHRKSQPSLPSASDATLNVPRFAHGIGRNADNTISKSTVT